MPKQILSISYDAALLDTRKLLLESAGFVVVDGLGFTEGIKACRHSVAIDFVIICHSIPHSDKMTLLSYVRKSCIAPVLSIVRNSEPPMHGVDFYVSSQDGPEAFLKTVQRATQSQAAEAAD